jgi:hypothetical protein
MGLSIGLLCRESRVSGNCRFKRAGSFHHVDKAGPQMRAALLTGAAPAAHAAAKEK